jgi:hypothetical protein
MVTNDEKKVLKILLRNISNLISPLLLSTNFIKDVDLYVSPKIDLMMFSQSTSQYDLSPKELPRTYTTTTSSHTPLGLGLNNINSLGLTGMGEYVTNVCSDSFKNGSQLAIGPPTPTNEKRYPTEKILSTGEAVQVSLKRLANSRAPSASHKNAHTPEIVKNTTESYIQIKQSMDLVNGTVLHLTLFDQSFPLSWHSFCIDIFVRYWDYIFSD